MFCLVVLPYLSAKNTSCILSYAIMYRPPIIILIYRKYQQNNNTTQRGGGRMDDDGVYCTSKEDRGVVLFWVGAQLQYYQQWRNLECTVRVQQRIASVHCLAAALRSTVLYQYNTLSFSSIYSTVLYWYSNNRSLVEKAVGGRAGDLSDPITGPTSDRRDM